MEQLIGTFEDLEQMLDKRLSDLYKSFSVVERDLDNGGVISETVYNDLSRQVMALVHISHHNLCENSELNAQEKAFLIEKLRKALLPYILQTETTSRFFTKPLGYAGDYVAIENIYNNIEHGSTKLGEIVDKMHLESQTSIAVRNRRQLIAHELCKLFKPNTPLSILTIASGPAREIYDVYQRIKTPELIKTTLIDFDSEALAFCRQWIDKNHWQKQITTLQVAIVNLMVGRTPTTIEPQDVVYSIGITDYFQDKHVIKLLDYVYSILKPNGKVILGNFHKSNLFKEYMDNILEWKLIHRDEDDMNRLLLQSKFAQKGRIFFEPSGLNMFLEGKK
jgi:extracellular factor (EF) 3-hydroxypalmitic acid methyl ester biosynthesis protein